jgi:hypothetical protein
MEEIIRPKPFEFQWLLNVPPGIIAKKSYFLATPSAFLPVLWISEQRVVSLQACRSKLMLIQTGMGPVAQSV